MLKTTYLLAVVITFTAIYIPPAAEERGFVEQEYLDVMLTDPRNGNVLDFLEDTDRMDFNTLARKAYEEGNYIKAARYHLASLQNIQDPMIMYYLACDYALLGEADLSCRALEYAVKAGYNRLNRIDRDPDFDGIRDSDIFKTTLADLTAYLGNLPDKEENSLYVKGMSYSPGIVVLPDDYNPEQTYPVLVALHGGASSPEEILKLCDMFTDPGFIFVALRAQNPTLWEGKLGYDWIYRETTNRDVQLDAIGMTETYILDAVSAIKDKYKTSGIYLAGFSEGGGMTYIAGIKHPDVFEGIIPISGFMIESVLTDEILAAGNGLRVFVIHGSADKGVPYDGAAQAFGRLINAGYDAELYTHDGGHELNVESIKKAQEWMELFTGD